LEPSLKLIEVRRAVDSGVCCLVEYVDDAAGRQRGRSGRSNQVLLVTFVAAEEFVVRRLGT